MHLTQSIFRTYSALSVWVGVLAVGISLTAAPSAFCAPQEAQTPAAESNPIVLSVQASQPSTPPELARAIQIMLDISRDDLAIQYIGQLEQMAAGDQEWFELMRRSGSEFVMRLATYPGVQPAGRNLAEKILAAAGRFANDPGRLTELTRLVADPNIVTRSTALENLQALGEVGAAAILNALADESRASDQGLLRTALSRCNQASEEPILGGIQSNDARLRYESVRAARFLDSSESVSAALLRPALEEEGSAELRSAAIDSLKQLRGFVPDRAQAAHILRESIDRRLSNRPRPGDQFLAPKRIWRTHPDGKVLVELKRSRLVAERIEAAERAEDLIKIRPDSVSSQRLYVLALLEAAKYVRGFEINLSQSKELEFARNAGPEFMEQILSEALKRELIGAAAGACEILGEIGDERLLRGESIRPLVGATSFGDLRVRFAACHAIMAIDPKSAFPGSSAVADAIMSLAQTSGRAKVLVGHPKEAFAQSMANTVEQMGFEAEAISNGQELIRRATEDVDVEYVVLSEMLGTPTYQDIIFQLRTHPRTKQLPIALQFRTDLIEVAWQGDAARAAVQVYLVVDTRQFANYDEWLRRTRDLAGLRIPLLLIVRPGDTEIAFGWSAGDSLVKFWELDDGVSAINKALPEQVKTAFNLTRTPISLVLAPQTVPNEKAKVEGALVLDPGEWVFWPEWTKQLHDNEITNRIDVVRVTDEGLVRQAAEARALDQPSDSDQINIDDLDFLYTRVSDLLSTEETLTVSLTDAQAVTQARQFESRDQWIVAMPWTLDRNLVARQMDRLTQLASSTPVNSSQRHTYAGQAMEWLAKIANQPARYPFWELTAYDRRIGTIDDPLQLTPTWCQTLGNLGTPLAQRQLADVASQNQLPIELRQAAVAGLENAISRQGIMLTNEQIQLQYDRYNASEDLPEETQQILAAVLNAIERPTARR